MNRESLPKPVMITRAQALERMVNRLTSEPILAVDTESNSLYAYQERVCLIQFSTPKDDFLVDPLALDDLSPLEPLFADPKIEKIFHAAEYDLITMKRDFNFEFENLFDTMVAARILGWEAIGLGSILKSEFDVELNKRYQRANWGKRPIPPDMMAYARLDTHYLIPLEPCWRVRGAYDLTPRQAAVLLALCHYRTKVAKSINRPLFKVIGDRTLLAIAEARPRSTGELKKVPELSEKQYQRHEKGLLRAVEKGLKADPIYPPRNPRPDEQFLARLESLRTWRKSAADQMQVKSDVILPRGVMHTIATRDAHDCDA
jgi:ribonuclease D